MARVAYIPNCPFHPCPSVAAFAEGTAQVFKYQFLNLYSFKFVLIFVFLNTLCYIAKSAVAQQTISAAAVSKRWLD